MEPIINTTYRIYVKRLTVLRI